MRWIRSLLLLPALGAACVSGGADPAEARPAVRVDLHDGMILSDEDLAAITELAAMLGLGPIEKVDAGITSHPSDCFGAVATEWKQSPDPTRLCWKTLVLKREHSDCPLLNVGLGPILVLRGWQASPLTIGEHELRRITVGEWHADVNLTSGGHVPYDVAVQLVTALKTGTARADAPFTAADADRITLIGSGTHEPAPSAHGDAGHAAYKLFLRDTPHRTVLTLCLEPDGVVVVSRAPMVEGRT